MLLLEYVGTVRYGTYYIKQATGDLECDRNDFVVKHTLNKYNVQGRGTDSF